MTPTVLDDYREMRRIRRAEETLMKLKEAGEVPGSIHLCNGQEAIPVAACSLLGDGDFVTATYRGHGWLLARGAAVAELFAEAMGRDSALNGGRGASPYASDREHNFIGENSIVGAGVPVALGAALTAARQGKGAISIVSIGDGATNQGNVHEALNMAAVHQLPLVIVVENNVYSEMSPISDMVRIDQLSERAKAYGMPGVTVDGNDPDALRAALNEAVERARSGKGPSLIEAMTERLVGHYSGDVQHYRPAGEVEQARLREPLVRLRQAHPEQVDEFDRIDAEIEKLIEEATEEARNRPEPSPETAKDHVHG